MNFLSPLLPPRFWAKVSPLPFPTYGTSGCWLWTGSTTSKGYGSFNLGKDAHGRQRTGVAHKMTVEASGVRIPDGWVVDHLCRNRCCVNPDHLEPVPDHVNNARGESPSARNAKVTCCPRGHAYTPENTYHYRRKRYCRECHRGPECSTLAPSERKMSEPMPRNCDASPVA